MMTKIFFGTGSGGTAEVESLLFVDRLSVCPLFFCGLGQ